MRSLLRANKDGVRAQQHSMDPAVEQHDAACSLTMPPNMGSCIAFAADIIMGSCTQTNERERRAVNRLASQHSRRTGRHAGGWKTNERPVRRWFCMLHSGDSAG